MKKGGRVEEEEESVTILARSTCTRFQSLVVSEHQHLDLISLICRLNLHVDLVNFISL